jgi:hypothetical protein
MREKLGIQTRPAERKPRPRDVSLVGQPVPESEYKNLLKKCDIYKKANEVLRKQMNVTMDPEAHQHLQNKLSDKDVKIKELTQELSTCKGELRRLGKDVENAADVNHDYPTRINSLMGENRALKEKIKTYLARQQNDEKLLRQQQEHMVLLESKLRKVAQQFGLRDADIQVALEPRETTAMDENKTVQERFEFLRKLREEEKRKFAAVLLQNQNRIESQAKQIESISSALKEKDAELKLHQTLSQTTSPAKKTAKPPVLAKLEEAPRSAPGKAEQQAERRAALAERKAERQASLAADKQAAAAAAQEAAPLPATEKKKSIMVRQASTMPATEKKQSVPLMEKKKSMAQAGGDAAGAKAAADEQGAGAP